MAQLGPLSSPALHPALPSASTPALLGMEHPIPPHPTPGEQWQRCAQQGQGHVGCRCLALLSPGVDSVKQTDLFHFFCKTFSSETAVPAWLLQKASAHSLPGQEHN